MSARYLICVVRGGQYRVAQYGHEYQHDQWYGDFESQGRHVIRFLTTADLDRFCVQVDKIKVLTDGEVRERWDDALAEARSKFGYESALRALHLTPDYGSNILGYVLNTSAPEVYHSLDFAADSLFCEFAYVINLDTRGLEIFEGFNVAPLAKGERFYGFEKRLANREAFIRRAACGKPYYPIRHFRTLRFSELGPETELTLPKPLETGRYD